MHCTLLLHRVPYHGLSSRADQSQVETPKAMGPSQPSPSAVRDCKHLSCRWEATHTALCGHRHC